MRHRKRGRRLNRSAPHRRAMSRNLITSFFDQFGDEKEYILTTVAKAKEYQPFAEKLITLGKKGNAALSAAGESAGMTGAEVLDGWKASRRAAREARRVAKAKARGLEVEPKELSEDGETAALRARFDNLDAEQREKIGTLLSKALHYRRLVFSRLRDESMTKKLFEEIAPVYQDRAGGYTRVLKTSVRRLGDGAYKAMLAFTPYQGETAAAAS